jgi:hypothetical protein
LAVGGGLVAPAILFPDGAPWEGFAVFHEGEAGGVIAGVLGGAQFVQRTEEAEEQGFLRGARADYPGGDAVDAGIEEIEADVDAANGVAGGYFLEDAFGGIIEDDDVIAVPADAAADVEKETGNEKEDG